MTDDIAEVAKGRLRIDNDTFVDVSVAIGNACVYLNQGSEQITLSHGGARQLAEHLLLRCSYLQSKGGEVC